MTKYSRNQLQEIKKLSENFTKKVLDGYSPDNKCFSLSYALSLYLKNKGFENTLKSGHLTEENHDKTGTSHFWIELSDVRRTIIDPTIRQFYSELPLVYIGKKLGSFKTDEREFELWFENNDGNEGVYEAWVKRFFPDMGNKTIGPAIEQWDKATYKMFLIIHLRAATILYTDNEVMFDNSYLHRKYFAFIFSLIRQHKSSTAWKEFSLPEKFDRLLNKAEKGQLFLTTT